MRKIIEVFLKFEDTEESKTFPNEAFGYWKIVVERPLRLKVELNDASLLRFRRACEELKEAPLANVVERVARKIGEGPHMDFNLFWEALEGEAERTDVKLSPKRTKLVQTVLAEKDDNAEPVVAKLHKPGKIEADPLHGLYPINAKG